MKKHSFLAMAVAALILLAGCGNNPTPPSSQPSVSEPGAETTHTLYIEGPATMVENYNPFGPGEKGPGLSFIYDALVYLDYQHPEDPIKPWLAKAWEFSPDGKQLTFTLRDDVTFSDGTSLTAKDVVFTLSVPLTHPELNPWGGSYERVEAPNDTTVVLTYPEVAYGQLAALASAPIVQETQWKDEDVSTFTNPKPIGSGMFTLDKIHPKSATFDVRKDYWQGESAVDRVEMVAYSADTFKLQLERNELQWCGAAWTTAETEFVASDPENHHAYIVPHGGAESLVFNSNKAPFNDVHARRAVALSIDIARLADISGLPAPSPCGFTASRYADSVLIPECQGGALRAMDKEAALSELESGGWSVENGMLVKDGESIQVTFAYPVSWTSAEPIYRDIKAQLKEVLGLDVKLITPPGDQYDAAVEDAHAALRFTGGATGMLGAFQWMGTPNNMGGWTDEKSTEIMNKMLATNPQDADYIELGKQMQKIIYDEVPFIPTVGGNWSVLINSESWEGWPEDIIKSDYLASPYNYTSVQMIMLDLKPKA